MSPETAFPDPLLSANLYFENHQDHALKHLVLPFWQTLESQGNDTGYLWFVRYGRGGGHLKLRIHAREALRPLLRDALTTATAAYLAAEEEEAPLERNARADLPPIDPQDEVTTSYPDRTLLWTEYRRSHISLGGKPFLDDDRYCALFTRAVGGGSAFVLTALQLKAADGAASKAAGEVPHSQRQAVLLKLLFPALGLLFPETDDRAAYLSYHRDWLVRFSLFKKQSSPSDTEKVLNAFDAQAERTAEKTLAPLRRRAEVEWSRGATVETEDPLTAWRSALASFLAYVQPLSADPTYDQDPFARQPVFAPIFKVLHGMANQVGLNFLDEAFTYHLLWSACSPVGVPYLLPEDER